MDISQGFEVKVAKNGGFVVSTRGMPGTYSDVVGAFTSAGDLIGWLVKELGAGPLDVPAIAVSAAISRALKPHASSHPDAQAAVEAYKALEPQWITWNGGECPVPLSKAAETLVEVEFRTGSTSKRHASECLWQRSEYDRAGDIMRYRVIA